ncbi:hypothetical protein APZ41_013050 [Roseomonas mucosa]|uniref:Uncharacterized protein n=1 Tax=Roseomonas mucosa TaxID=207340 RepID=A0A1S8D3C8_9PROT|nr:hypothetical protein APZ41_013050 [Roseomonas mucosa]
MGEAGARRAYGQAPAAHGAPVTAPTNAMERRALWWEVLGQIPRPALRLPARQAASQIGQAALRCAMINHEGAAPAPVDGVRRKAIHARDAAQRRLGVVGEGGREVARAGEEDVVMQAQAPAVLQAACRECVSASGDAPPPA